MKISPLTKTLRSRCGRAFSLVEVSLVIGIAAIAILPLVSLLPTGLNTLRQSTSRTAEARMLQAIAADYQMRVWVKASTGIETRIVELNGTDYYFDDAGLPATKGSREHIYTAKTLPNAAGPALNTDGSGGVNPYLRALKVRITDKTGDDQALADNSGLYWERSLLVANLEQTGPITIP